VEEGEGSPKLSCDVVYCEDECANVRTAVKLRPRSWESSLKAYMEVSLATKAPLSEIAGSSISKALIIDEAWVAMRRRLAVPDDKANVERPHRLQHVFAESPRVGDCGTLANPYPPRKLPGQGVPRTGRRCPCRASPKGSNGPSKFRLQTTAINSGCPADLNLW